MQLYATCTTHHVKRERFHQAEALATANPKEISNESCREASKYDEPSSIESLKESASKV